MKKREAEVWLAHYIGEAAGFRCKEIIMCSVSIEVNDGMVFGSKV